LRGLWILGEDDDPHTVIVATKCQQAGAAVLVGSHHCDGTLGAISHPAGAQDGSRFRLDAGAQPFDVVWNRLKPVSLTETSDADMFVARERHDFVMSAVACFIPFERRLNDPWAQNLARLKPFQLALAREVGLDIPKTIVTDGAAHVLSFFDDDEAMIYKPVTWLATLQGEVLFTNRIGRAAVAAAADAISRAPGIYQAEIPKACEYRVTIVDDTVFAVRIYSQDRADTVVDWRRNHFALKYERVTLPAAVEQALFEIMRRCRLRFGAFDLIERPTGEFVFLEVNPAGNWLWLEDRLELPISDRIVAALLEA
jgi:glutathione synthase/RimK-type ligase-like ATP-grasp enzyme